MPIKKRSELSDKNGMKTCPYCGEEIKKIARKCRYCHEFLDEEIGIIKKEKKYKCNGCGQLVKIGDKECPKCGADLNWGNVGGKKRYKCNGCGQLVKIGDKKCPKCGADLNWGNVGGKKRYKCNGCGQLVKIGDKECPKCGTQLDWTYVYKKDNSILRNWEDLSVGEQSFIIRKMQGMKILTVFFTGIGLMRSKRWGAFFGCMAISLIGLFGGPFGLISVIITRIIALVNFSKEAYKHDKPYFQKYLNEYNQLNFFKN